jgi:transposase
MKPAVARGLERGSLDKVRHVGIDEKSFGKGQDYVTVMTDIDQSRVLDVTPDCTMESADGLWIMLSRKQRRKVKAVCMTPENPSDEKNDEVAALRWSTLATGRAWSINEMFRFFWQEGDAAGGRAFLDSWYAWAIRSRLAPIKQVARMLKTRLDRILT